MRPADYPSREEASPGPSTQQQGQDMPHLMGFRAGAAALQARPCQLRGWGLQQQDWHTCRPPAHTHTLLPMLGLWQPVQPTRTSSFKAKRTQKGASQGPFPSASAHKPGAERVSRAAPGPEGP